MKQSLLQYRFILPVLILCSVFAPARLWAAPRIGQVVPDFKMVTTSGQVVSLEKYRGQVLLLDFFATWCQPCRDSIPHLNDLNRKYSRQGLQVLGVCTDEDGEKSARIFAERNRISYPVAMAGESVLADFGVRSVPILFVVDKHGKIAEVFRGYTDVTGRAQEQLIKKLLAEK